MACLPKPGLDVTGKPLIVSGWGITSYIPDQIPFGPSPDTLQFTILYGISNEECSVEYKNGINVTADILCAMSKNHDTASCSGDSGGNGNK